ncbi:prion-inhibition and propagation-domain-containing protein [Stachybotrys elegans]|uniref:Prion-inhibition and propagation-domain-containing protein n=1 Tax=Stachybotrys elegans TaxID=80388 RepID=A0A8K0WXE0_9HYPO|nr:prion-inhibition and propagation-domain-containing protein [Stachybotrys elegans]
MAETAATAAGIAGIVGVLQSLLQCYKDFLTARDFGDDFALCQLRAALLENSTVTWAIAVGLQHESGEPRNEFLVQRPTEKNATLVRLTLDLIRKWLGHANEELDIYTTEGAATEDDASVEEVAVGAESPGDRPSRVKRFANKIHRTAHRQHDNEHPGTLKRTTWALVDKARLEATLDKVTTLVDRLNTDFAPVDQKRQLDQYCEVVKELKLSDEELRELGAEIGDKIFKTVVKMLQNERATGDRFLKMQVTKEGTVNIGDYYDTDWKGDGQRQSSRNDTFEELSVTDTAFVNIGDNFGGKSPLQIRLEQQQEAARRAQSGGVGN